MEFELSEIDFRFADDEDAEDIAFVVNRSYKNEEEGPYAFRMPGPRIEPTEIVSDFATPSKRWILLESPRPEELVMAAMRIIISRDTVSKAVVDIIACVDSIPIRNLLLNRAEAVCQSLGCEKLIIEVPSWLEPVQDWLACCGYADLGTSFGTGNIIVLTIETGGHMWPEELGHMITKPTLVMEFQKSLKQETPNYSTKASSTTESSAISDLDSAPGAMTGLIDHLFRALHAEAASANIASDSPDIRVGPTGDMANILNSLSLNDVQVDGCNVTFSTKVDIDDQGISSVGDDVVPSDADDAMKTLIGDLFRALHAEAVTSESSHQQGAPEGSL